MGEAPAAERARTASKRRAASSAPAAPFEPPQFSGPAGPRVVTAVGERPLAERAAAPPAGVCLSVARRSRCSAGVSRGAVRRRAGTGWGGGGPSRCGGLSGGSEGAACGNSAFKFGRESLFCAFGADQSFGGGVLFFLL